MASLELKGIHKVFQKTPEEAICAVDTVNCSVSDGELVTVLGPSGCGKTTLLRLIAGLEVPTAGNILLGGKDVTRQPPHERNIAMVSQQPALLPHLSALENISLGLRLRRVDAAEALKRVDLVVDLFGLRRVLARLPQELSGGEQQRVSLARSLVRKPDVLLLDEPLSSLDAPLRSQLRLEIARIRREMKMTVLYVTHDQSEALALGDRTMILREGTIQQLADATTLLTAPANAFVAGFVGSPPMNLLRGRIVQKEGMFVFRENNPAGVAAGTHLELPLNEERGKKAASFADGNVTLGIRPESVSVYEFSSGNQATVEVCEPIGRETLFHLTSGAQRFVAAMPGLIVVKPGHKVSVSIDMERAVFFHPVSDKPFV